MILPPTPFITFQIMTFDKISKESLCSQEFSRKRLAVPRASGGSARAIPFARHRPSAVLPPRQSMLEDKVRKMSFRPVQPIANKGKE
ncbi:hypothetical protein J2Z66_005989 [Paenibacillus eucommiae]|uniref:Uncharacterized protein n=1 Tax=Paenibacillus eucommiae TaxID=1355755 RepID=A0ABS4J3G6_9BACL|nr:hypothetical protein [Paenibacillus eucommiae]